jgi:hypothetical protein
VEDLLSWDVPFDHLEAPQGLASRVEAVEKEGVRAWRVLFFQRPSDGAKEGPAVLGARVLPEPPGLPPLTLEGSTLAFAGWRLALLGLPHGLFLPAYRPLLDGAPCPALGLTFPLGGARCYGLGERARGLERRGGRYWNLTADRFPRPGDLYALGMAEATFRGLSALGRHPFILTRSGFPGIQRYAFAWTGDNASRFEDLALSIPMLLSLGLSDLPFAGADVGGFNEDATPELLTRWMWLGALYPFFRNHRRRARPCPWPSPATPPPPPAFPTSPSAWSWGRRSGGGSTRTRGTARKRGSGGRCAAPLTESASTSFWKSLGKGSWPRSWECPGPFGSGEGSGGRGGFFWTWEKGKPGPAGPEMRLSQKARHQGHGGLQDGL